MKLSKRHKQLLHDGAIAAFYVLAFGTFIFFQAKKLWATKYQLANTNIEATSPKDTAPLPIPEEVIKSGKTLRVPILMYHHIGTVPEGADRGRYGLTIPAEQFEEEIKWLKDNGYNSVSLNGLYNSIATQSKLPQKPVIITLDDGYDDAFTVAMPILKKYGYTATFGIITQFTGLSQGTNTYATWQQIAQGKQQGMEIMCHTQNHFDGSDKRYTADYIFNNLQGCQQDIKDHLGSAVPYVMYPYGHYTDMYIQQAKKVGFVMGLTVHEGSLINLNDLMRMPRVRVSRGESMENFIKAVAQ